MAPPSDVRSFGVQAQPGGRTVYDPNWLGRKDLDAARFREWTEGELRVVRADFPNGPALQWWVDPKKGWSIVRASQFSPDGSPSYESRSSLTEFDGTWLPSEVAFFRSDFRGGKLAYQTIRIQNAAINRPEQPARFGPGDLGLETGTMVAMHDPETMQATDLRAWNGNALVSMKEWRDGLHAGTASYSPGFMQEVARGREESATSGAADNLTHASSVSQTKVQGKIRGVHPKVRTRSRKNTAPVNLVHTGRRDILRQRRDEFWNEKRSAREGSIGALGRRENSLIDARLKTRAEDI